MADRAESGGRTNDCRRDEKLGACEPRAQNRKPGRCWRRGGVERRRRDQRREHLLREIKGRKGCGWERCHGRERGCHHGLGGDDDRRLRNGLLRARLRRSNRLVQPSALRLACRRCVRSRLAHRLFCSRWPRRRRVRGALLARATRKRRHDVDDDDERDEKPERVDRGGCMAEWDQRNLRGCRWSRRRHG